MAAFQIRITAEERDEWKESARAAGHKTISGWIRSLICAEIGGIATAELAAGLPQVREPSQDKAAFRVSPSCSAPGDRCRRFKKACCEPCRKLNAKSFA